MPLEMQVLGVASLSGTQSPSQGIFVGRTDNQVDMIGHDTVAKDSQAMAMGVFPEQGEVDEAVLVGEEDILAIVPPLRNMMRKASGDESRSSWPLTIQCARESKALKESLTAGWSVFSLIAACRPSQPVHRSHRSQAIVTNQMPVRFDQFLLSMRTWCLGSTDGNKDIGLAGSAASV